MSYEEVDSENTDIPESVRRERRIRKANEENPMRIDEVIEAYKPKEFNKLADRYDELGYDGLAKHYRRKDKEEKKRKPNGCFVVIACVSLILYVLSNLVSIEFDDTYNSSNSTVETTDIESKTEPETETEPSMWVTTTRVKVRTEPNTNCDVLGVLDAGVQVDYTGDANEEWVTIDYNGQEAYVYKKYIQELINNEVYNSEEIPETSVVETIQETVQSVEKSENQQGYKYTIDIGNVQDLRLKYSEIMSNPDKYIGQKFFVLYYVDSMKVAQDFEPRGQVYYTGYYFDIDDYETKHSQYPGIWGKPSIESADINKPIWLMDKRNTDEANSIKINNEGIIKVYGVFKGIIKTNNSPSGELSRAIVLDLYLVEPMY